MEAQVVSPSTPSSRGMDKYEQLAVVGEGSYGVVLKCRRRDNGKLVAIKKFLETEEDAAVRKMALREIRMLKKLRHHHLVNMIEVFRRKRRFYLVFEYLDHTLLDELEGSPGGLDEDTSKKHLYQLLKGIEFCHQNSIIHRDVKPENVLVSKEGVVKLCDLGFARTLAAPGEPYTEYVATRWYRAPELLVAEHRYGPEIDIWAIGCLFAEMLTGDPLFPGDSDIDQLALIMQTIGKLASRHQQIVSRLAGGAALCAQAAAARAQLPGSGHARELLTACLRTEPRARPSASALLRHKYFTIDGFTESFNAELRKKLGKSMSPPPPQVTTSRVSGKPRQQWTLSMASERTSSRANSVSGEALIDYNYTPGSDMHLDKKMQSSLPPAVSHAPSEAILTERAHHFKHLLPLSHKQKPKLEPLPTSLSSYPKTPYNKKVNNKMVIDELLRRKVPSKKSNKKSSEFSLPYVQGATKSPRKRVKKPLATIMAKTLEHFQSAHNGVDSYCARTQPTLPHM